MGGRLKEETLGLSILWFSKEVEADKLKKLSVLNHQNYTADANPWKKSIPFVSQLSLGAGHLADVRKK